MKVGRWFILIVATVLAVYPLCWMGLNTFKTNAELTQNLWGLPTEWTLSNLVHVWTEGHFGRYALNSLLVTLGSVIALTGVGSLAGYAFGRMEFIGKRLLWLVFMAGLFLPVHVSLIPLNQIEARLGIAGDWRALVFLGAVYLTFNLSFTVFYLRGFFADIPRELDDAARVDGCGSFGAFWRIYLPMSLPALSVVALVNTVMIWNEFVFALILLQSDEHYTLPIAVKTFSDDTAMNLALTCAALTLTVVPVIAIFILGQRWITRGLAAGAVKG